MRAVPSDRVHTPQNILLVDDNQDGNSARQSVLETLGYAVVAVHSAADALQQMEEREFDLIVTDLRMPSMSGIEMIASLRTRGCTKPIILLSGFVDALGLDPAASGADVVIQKSAQEINQLLRAARRLLSPARRPSLPEAGGKRTAKVR